MRPTMPIFNHLKAKTSAAVVGKLSLGTITIVRRGIGSAMVVAGRAISKTFVQLPMLGPTKTRDKISNRIEDVRNPGEGLQAGEAGHLAGIGPNHAKEAGKQIKQMPKTTPQRRWQALPT